MKTKLAGETGQVIILALIFLTVILTVVSLLVGFVGLNVQAGRRALASEQALHLAEGAVDKAVWQLNATGGAYTGETNTALGVGVFDVSIANISPTVKEITATGYVPGKTSPRAQKQIKVRASIAASVVSFNYAVQIGDGGLEMADGSRVAGNVYANGIITGAKGATITGDAISATASGKIKDMSVNGTAYAHTIQDSQVGGNARGYTLTGATVGGNALENTIANCTIGGNASYTTKTSCTIGGSQTTPYPGEPDPDAQSFPISDQQIISWKDEAAAGGTISGNYTLGQGQSASLGPKKITGDLIINKNATLTLTGRVRVAGKIDIDKDATVALDPSYGDNSEVLLADGIIDLSKESNFQRAGPASYVLAITTSSAGDAIKIAKSADALIAYAGSGTVTIQKESHLREVTAWKLKLEKDTLVTYEQGLQSVLFTAGPGASWIIQRGTYRQTD